MYCPSCGSPLPDNTAFCPNCGNHVLGNGNGGPSAQTPPNQPSGYPNASYPGQVPPQTPNNATYPGQVPPQAFNSADLAAQMPAPTSGKLSTADRNMVISVAERAGFGMNWYKFLIYFALFAGGVVNVILALASFTGLKYTNGSATPQLVYRVFGGLQVLDIIYGVLLIALAAFCIYERFLMARFSKKAPTYLYVIYIANGAITVVYAVVAMIVVFSTLESQYYSSASSTSMIAASFIGDIIGSLVGAVIMFVLNRIYFKKRAHLFVYE